METVIYDSVIDGILAVDKWFYGKISKVSRDFYGVYVRKCNEHNCHMNFFEVLYAYLIGYGFRRSKINKYVEIVRKRIVERLRRECPSINIQDDETEAC